MPERHTRQGLALGQSHGTLDREDLDLGSPGPWTWSSHKQAFPRVTLPGIGPVVGLDACWCGLPNGHYWRGRSEGAPHPDTWHGHLTRVLTEFRDGVERQLREALNAAAPAGLLVLVDRQGNPTRHCPAPDLPAGEIRTLRDPDPQANGGPRVRLEP